MPFVCYGTITNYDPRPSGGGGAPGFNIPSSVSANGLPTYYYPFWTDLKNYASGSGVQDYITAGAVTISNTRSYNVKASGSFNNSGTASNAFQIPSPTFDTTSTGTGLTVCMWIYFNASGGFPFSMTPSPGSWPRMFIYYLGAGIGIRFNPVLSSSVSNNDIFNSIANSTWYHFAWVLPPNQQPYVVINGQTSSKIYLIGYDYLKTGSTGSNFVSPKVCIAGDTFAGSSPFTGGSNCNINNFYLFPRSLSDTEVQALYNQ